MSSRLEQLLTMLADSPKDSFLTFAIAKEYEGSGAIDKAMEQYLLLVKNDPDYVGTYYHLGKCYEKKEDFATAIKVYAGGMEVAKKVGDRHSLSELAGARMEIDEEFEG